ncbi:RNA 3'-terminal phosphate cyclase [Catenovulum sp. SX2]|uniref:RNA 3'-terminal phosphate cyclase n=1 Tax=Catenovulum sp. SX2 TaxID=3398614 RepID=UPI003F872ECE
MSFIQIDGAQGEGGGQVLRTALTLSAITKQPFELCNIRANRQKPGLLRQHLTSVLAAQQVCNAEVEGAELGSQKIVFTPNTITAGEFEFSIGTAGSTVLVCQTILPILALAETGSVIKFEGGTHNGMSPSLCFLQQSYLPLLRKMGVQSAVTEGKYGFYPAGGGSWKLEITPAKKWQQLHLNEQANLPQQHLESGQIKVLLSSLPNNIAEREITTAKKYLNWPDAQAQIKQVRANGPGNSFQISLLSKNHNSVFEVIGELRVSAEQVAKRCAGRVKKFIQANAAVEEHLADQLLLPMALAGGGCFTTTKPSLHTQTNIKVIQQFVNIDIQVNQIDELLWEITLR